MLLRTVNGKLILESTLKIISKMIYRFLMLFLSHLIFLPKLAFKTPKSA